MAAIAGVLHGIVGVSKLSAQLGVGNPEGVARLQRTALDAISTQIVLLAQVDTTWQDDSFATWGLGLHTAVGNLAPLDRSTNALLFSGPGQIGVGAAGNASALETQVEAALSLQHPLVQSTALGKLRLFDAARQEAVQVLQRLPDNPKARAQRLEAIAEHGALACERFADVLKKSFPILSAEERATLSAGIGCGAQPQ